jgi:hypothetical protein
VSIDFMTSISEVWLVMTEVANARTAAWPLRSRAASAISSAPSWWAIIRARKIRSASTPEAADSSATWAGVASEYLRVWGPVNIAFGGHRYCLWVPRSRAVGGQRRPTARVSMP